MSRLKMSQIRDEFDRLLKCGMPDAYVVISTPTDSGHSFFAAGRVSMVPPKDVKPKDVRLCTGIDAGDNLIFIQG